METKELLEICFDAVEEVLNCTADGLINQGDGTEETQKEIDEQIKKYEKASRELQNRLNELNYV